MTSDSLIKELRAATKRHDALYAQALEINAQVQDLTRKVIEIETKNLPFKAGETYRVTAADRVARAQCIYAEAILLEDLKIGFNAVLLLEGSKSVICRIDHETFLHGANGEMHTSAVFSRDATSAAYHAARNQKEDLE
jgi:hypothetical protein